MRLCGFGPQACTASAFAYTVGETKNIYVWVYMWQDEKGEGRRRQETADYYWSSVEK